MAASSYAVARKLPWCCAQAGPLGTLQLSLATRPAATLSLLAWIMHWLIAAFFLKFRPARLVLTGMSLTTSRWSCSCSSQRLLCQPPHLHPRPPPPLGCGTTASEGPMQVPSCQKLHSCIAAAAAHQHSTSATGSAHLELADAKFRFAIDTAAQAAPLRRKRP